MSHIFFQTKGALAQILKILNHEKNRPWNYILLDRRKLLDAKYGHADVEHWKSQPNGVVGALGGVWPRDQHQESLARKL